MSWLSLEEAYARGAVLTRKGVSIGYIHLPSFYGGRGSPRDSATDIKKLLLTGVRPNGQPIAVMPTGFYGILLASDLDAIVAYVQTIAPVRNKVPAPIYKIAIKQDVYPGAEKPIDPALLNDSVKRGFYLGAIGHCMECHTPLKNGELDFERTGAGGQQFPGPWGVSVSSNITSSKSEGVGAWTDAELKRASKKSPPFRVHPRRKRTLNDYSTNYRSTSWNWRCRIPSFGKPEMRWKLSWEGIRISTILHLSGIILAMNKA